jgi:polyisoprenoid-binding protein YceI
MDAEAQPGARGFPMSKQFRSLAAAAAVLALTAAGQALAAACPPGIPAGVSCGEQDASLAPAGTYALDPGHTSVVARVSHIGYSYSTFRFGRPAGELIWTPHAPAQSKLTVKVETASISTPVTGFAEQLRGAGYLNTKAFPQATFTSTAFRPVDATHGQVDGQFTLLGKTRPVTFDVELVGAGAGFGKPRIGVQARTTLKTAEFGLPAALGAGIDLVIDAEFEKSS